MPAWFSLGLAMGLRPTLISYNPFLHPIPFINTIININQILIYISGYLDISFIFLILAIIVSQAKYVHPALGPGHKDYL